MYLSIYNPSNDTVQRSGASSVTLFLPRGPFSQCSEKDSATIDQLCTNIDRPIVKINYRCSQQNRFPTPLHDVLAGYDWVLENLLPKRSIVRAGRSETVGKVSVYGEYVGGGLATALALTECRTGQPGVVAAAIANPILDWTCLAETARVSKTRKADSSPKESGKDSSDELKKLLQLRSQLFAKPAHYFDPFASPLLFFRSAGIQTPDAPKDSRFNDGEQISVHQKEALELEQIEREAFELPDVVSLLQPRRASRRFPNKSLGLQLPTFYIAAEHKSLLAGQAEELASQLRRSLMRQRKDAAFSFGRKVLMQGEEDQMTTEEKNALEGGIEDGRKRVRLHVDDRLDDKAKAERLSQMAEWLASTG
jgi:acetyl esterase/lipase